MKKIAFFVEGQTEQLFVNRLLCEIAGQRNISVSLKQLRGGKTIPAQEILINQVQFYREPLNPLCEALIYDCGSDDKVKSDILENIESLSVIGFSEIVGIRDLFPLTDLERLKRGLKFIPPQSLPLSIPFEIIVAVNEIECWFLAEYTHFAGIHKKITTSRILNSFGFNPCEDDMRVRPNPANDLNMIYQLEGRGYGKKKNQVERTVNYLDYSELYLNIRHKIPELEELIQKIDSFLV